MKTCKICGSDGLTLVYEGKIRMGRFGDFSDEAVQVLKCQKCEVTGLADFKGHDREYYQDSSYRDNVDGGSDVEHFFRLHDKEQIDNLKVMGLERYRGKNVADIGCGGGSFLDAIRGYARSVIAVEPSTEFRNSLSSRGYKAYQSVEDAVCEHGAQVDIVVSLHVIEHVSDPLSFLSQMKSLIAPGGKLIVGTPNADDILLKALPDVFPSFFYRKAHPWYFSANALTNMLRKTGYENIKITPHHTLGLANFIAWLSEKEPKGNLQREYVTPIMDAAWKSELERTMRCDSLFAEAEAP